MENSALEIREVFEGLAYFANNQQLSDVKFIFDNGNGNNEYDGTETGTEPPVVYGHKVILASRSPVFRNMFTSDAEGKFTNSDNTIKIDDIAVDVFRILIKYLCSNEVPDLTIDLALDLLYCARKYMLTRLVEKCEAFLSLEMETNVDSILLIGCSIFNDYLGAELQAKCHRLQEEKATEILKSPLFLEINVKELCVFLGHDGLPLKEFKLFQALLSWAQHQCKKNGLTINSSNLRGIMGDALFQIRFPTMTIDEFTQFVVKDNDGLLTKDEAWNVFITMGSVRGCSMDMDSIFCVKRRNRPNKTKEKLKNPICKYCKKRVDIYYCNRIKNFCGAPGSTRAGRHHCECCGSNVSTYTCNNDNRYCGQIRQMYCWWCLEVTSKYTCQNGRMYCGFLGTTYEP